MKRAIVLVVALLACLTSGPALADPALPGTPCGADVQVPLRTFKVEGKWDKKSYRIGETAHFKVRVSRVADQDPVTDPGQEWPGGRPLDEPAPDVSIGVGMFVGDVYLTGGAITKADGTAVVPIKIQPYTKPGKATSRAYAEKIAIKDFPSSACRVVILEFGYLDPGPPSIITK